MKGAMFAVALLTVGCFSSPIFAQQQELQEVMDAANALSARQSELLSKKDAAGIASLFTSDGLLVMLAPQFAFKPGRDVIQKHYQGIIDAGTTAITLELKNMELRGNDGVWAAGNYSVTVKDKTIQGNWFRILEARERDLENRYGGVRSRWCCRCPLCRYRFLTIIHQQQIEQRFKGVQGFVEATSPPVRRLDSHFDLRQLFLSTSPTSSFFMIISSIIKKGRHGNNPSSRNCSPGK